MAKVSIIFPMYNVSKYVENSLKSVLSQTYRDYEVIAVNDGSKDDTVEVFEDALRKYNKNDIEVHLVNQQNGGLSDARNKGLSIASGEWVVFIDSDDVMHPEYLKTFVEDAEANGADLVIALRKCVDDDSLFSFDEVKKGKVVQKDILMKDMLTRRHEPYCGCFFIKQSLLKTNGISFNVSVRYSVDQAFMWQVVDVADKIVVNKSRLYNYYQRPGSIMTSSKFEQICSGLQHYSNTVNSLTNLPFSPDVVINRWKMGILHSASKLLDYDKYENLENDFKVNYVDYLKIPSFKSKVFAIIGVVSPRLLYDIFRKF